MKLAAIEQRNAVAVNLPELVSENFVLTPTATRQLKGCVKGTIMRENGREGSGRVRFKRN